MKLFPRRFGSVVAISFALLGVVTVACGAASTATPTAATIVPAPTTTQAAIATATPTPPPPAPAQTAVQTTGKGGPVFIQLTDPLDEPQFYCLDVPGAGTAVRLDSPLQAHTCKPLRTAEDELFTLNHPSDGQIYMEAYNLCIEANGTAAGSTVVLQPCSDSPNQRFSIDDGSIRLAGDGPTGLCLAVDPKDGIPTGGPSHLRRDLTLEGCDSIDTALSRWIFGIFDY